MWESTLTSKGQMTIPKEVRDTFGLQAGDEVIFDIVDGRVVLTFKNVDFNDLAGLLGKPPSGGASLEEIDRAVLSAAGANAAATSANDRTDFAA